MIGRMPVSYTHLDVYKRQLRRSDEHDRRITKLYVTKKGEAIVEMINQVLADWHAIITDGLSDEECEVTARLMGRVAANAAAFVKKK